MSFSFNSFTHVEFIHQPLPIKAFNAVPRFGHTSDIASIYEDEIVQLGNGADYVQGTIFVAGVCLSAFILWILALIIAKCLGPKAGVAGGYRLEQTTKELPKKHLYWRVFMLTSSIVIVISGLVFLIAGANSVTQVFDDVKDGASVSLLGFLIFEFSSLISWLTCASLTDVQTDVCRDCQI